MTCAYGEQHEIYEGVERKMSIYILAFNLNKGIHNLKSDLAMFKKNYQT